MTRPTLVQAFGYFDWLWGQAMLGGWMYVALAGVLVCATVALTRDRRAWPALLLPFVTVLPLVLATVGWSFSNHPERTAPWVPVAAVAALASWLPLTFIPIVRAKGQWLPLIGAGLLSAPALLLSCALAAMSGSGDWI